MKKPACISTIILNWNRVACLKKTVESYLSTIKAPYQLIVVDNASTDGSVAYLREIEASGKAHVVYLDENIGGLAYNKVFDLANGEWRMANGEWRMAKCPPKCPANRREN